MNSIIIKGRIVRDIELKQTTSGKEVINFTVAVDRRNNRDETDFFDCTAWSGSALFINNYFKKGQEIIINGFMQSRSWDDTGGTKHYKWELIVQNVEFCGSKSA